MGRRKVIQYLILWKGYPVHEATWEPVEQLDGALDLVIDYNKKKKINIGSMETDALIELTAQTSSGSPRSYAVVARGLGA